MADPWQTFNRTEAFESLHNLQQANVSVNLSNYSSIQKMTNASALDNTSTAASSIFTPITDFWAGPALWGSWFYVALIFFTIGMIYVKSQNLFRTCTAMLFMGLCAVAPESLGVIYIPSAALYTLYVLTGVGLAGVLYQMWVSD
ncbi:hypothetical protein MSKOL_1616 [Methanosarcina sp. Kolksee]|uniref:hypothetical protein n=1 Tax=Methanosarcina sp. Kolksee TaxID=1434099 RepID=UPI000615D25E|nr:hypothetical protein [Methanosarcina sp. Kolksee]AKB47393.1 hypothetical protein MSKOL_1616 [Methanosarcina sp. Kolksee]